MHLFLNADRWPVQIKKLISIASEVSSSRGRSWNDSHWEEHDEYWQQAARTLHANSLAHPLRKSVTAQEHDLCFQLFEKNGLYGRLYLVLLQHGYAVKYAHEDACSQQTQKAGRTTFHHTLRAKVQGEIHPARLCPSRHCPPHVLSYLALAH